jgi:F-type H+-transporting ATPase subunit epsilon
MSQFQVCILAADHTFYDGPCESLVVPTPQGQYGILAHHSNLIAAIVPGLLLYRLPGETALRTAAVSAGMVKVEDNHVLVLVDSAERPEDIDTHRAKRAAEKAQEELLQQKSIREYRTAQASLARAMNRLQVKDHYEKKK